MNNNTVVKAIKNEPTKIHVYGILNKHSEFSEFFELAKTEFASDMLAMIGFKDKDWTENSDEWKAEQNKYRIFVDGKGYNPQFNEKLVRFFNNYRYTIYVPTNAGMQEAYAKGLPRLSDFEKFVAEKTIPADPDVEDSKPYMEKEDQLKAQAMVNMIVNFVKYHFQDQAFYVDHADAEGEFQTSCVDLKENIYLPIKMKQTDGRISVTDNAGATQDVIQPYNLLARDSNFDNLNSKSNFYQ